METSRKEAIRAELATARAEFHELMASFSERDLRRPSLNPGWTNREIMFHMVLAFLLLPTLVTIARFWNRAPARSSRAFAAALNWSTPVFNVVNAVGPRGAARIFYGRRLERLYDRQYRAVLRKLERLREEDLWSGMPYPSRWDPLFDDFMTIGGLFTYPVEHFRFHAGQLAGPETSVSGQRGAAGHG